MAIHRRSVDDLRGLERGGAGRGGGGRGGVGGQGLERVDHVLEIDRDDVLELGADRALEVGAAQALERELEDVGEDVVAGDAEVDVVVIDLEVLDQLRQDPAGPGLVAIVVAAVAGGGRDAALDVAGERGVAQAGLRDRDLEAPGAQIDGDDAVGHDA